MKSEDCAFDETREAESLTSMYSNTTFTFSSSCVVRFSGNSAISFSTPNLRFASEAESDVGDIEVLEQWWSLWMSSKLLQVRC